MRTYTSSGWRKALLRALSDPALAAFDGDTAALPATAEWAAYGVAVALGQCRLFGAELATDDGSLTPNMGFAAAHKWEEFLREWTGAVREIHKHREKEGAMELLDVALDPLVQRMDCWAAFVAIDEAYEEAIETSWPRRHEFAHRLDACLAGLEGFDEALKEQLDHLVVAARTALLDNWRKMLASEYRVALPWWLDGTLDRCGRGQW